MQNIPISLAEPGMVLARDIMRKDNPDGPPICGRGMALTESLIERLQNMGIPTVMVEGHPLHIEGEQTLEEMLEALDLRFSKVEENPMMMKLKDVYRALIRRSMGVDGGR